MQTANVPLKPKNDKQVTRIIVLQRALEKMVCTLRGRQTATVRSAEVIIISQMLMNEAE
jgi:hypothetical protein